MRKWSCHAVDGVHLTEVEGIEPPGAAEFDEVIRQFLLKVPSANR